MRLDKAAKGQRTLLRSVSVSLSANYTLTAYDLGRRWVFTLAAARDVDVAVLTDPRQWVEIMNDSASTNDLTVKNGGTTIVTLAPGASVAIGADSAGALEAL